MATLSPVLVPPESFPAARDAFARIDRAARDADGHESLGEAVWLDLSHPDADSAAFVVDDSAVAHVARADNDTDSSTPRWSLALAVAPAARDGNLPARLLDAALAHVATRGGGRVTYWVFAATDADDARLAAHGLRPARDLCEMRVDLPIAEPANVPAGFSVRQFVPGNDDDAWLAVNNRAFAGHAEQGGWTRDTLARRVAESWFDPALFLLALDSDGVAGFNWLKVHPADSPEPALGEIFVIGTDPRVRGSGLGRALALLGLAAVASRGVTTGMLFVAADNEVALRLYRSIGFTEHRRDRAYELDVAPA